MSYEAVKEVNTSPRLQMFGHPHTAKAAVSVIDPQDPLITRFQRAVERWRKIDGFTVNDVAFRKIDQLVPYVRLWSREERYPISFGAAENGGYAVSILNVHSERELVIEVDGDGNTLTIWRSTPEASTQLALAFDKDTIADNHHWLAGNV